MSIKKRDIRIGDLIMVDFDYTICASTDVNVVYVVDQPGGYCYFIMGMGKPVRNVNKKKCRPYRDIYAPRTVDEFKS